MEKDLNTKGQIQTNNDFSHTIRSNLGICISDNNLFIKDKDFNFLLKKTEKIASATYLLTGFFSDQDPIKWSLRRSALNLLSVNLSLKSNKADYVKDWLNLQETSSFRVISLLETAFLSGLISEMNFFLLKKELISTIQSARRCADLFKNTQPNLAAEIFMSDKSNYPIKDILKSGLIQSTTEKITKGQNNFEKAIKKSHDYLNNQTETVDEKSKKNQRQIIIIDFIKSSKSASIKDISDLIKDCSEKTIQRELLSMVKKGVLKKTGERRWSRYSLNLQ